MISIILYFCILIYIFGKMKCHLSGSSLAKTIRETVAVLNRTGKTYDVSVNCVSLSWRENWLTIICEINCRVLLQTSINKSHRGFALYALLNVSCAYTYASLAGGRHCRLVGPQQGPESATRQHQKVSMNEAHDNISIPRKYLYINMLMLVPVCYYHVSLYVESTTIYLHLSKHSLDQ